MILTLNRIFILIISISFLIGITTVDESFAAKSEVSIPQGAATPGCETTDSCYSPSNVSINKGDRVVWINNDSTVHTVTSGTPSGGSDGKFDSDLFMAGKSFEHQFNDSGTFPYYCVVHPWMKGTVTVSGGSGGSGQGGPGNPNNQLSCDGVSIELDQLIYTWTDKVYITVFAYCRNFDPNAIDVIGTSDNLLYIKTSKQTLSPYQLIETGVNTGIFTGEVTLTGFANHDADGDGSKNDATGAFGGSGPTGGLLSSTEKDSLIVTYTPTSGQEVTVTAQIQWNIGQVSWLEASYPSSGTGWVRVIDKDMDLNPNVRDSFEITVFSSSNTNGLKVIVTESNEATGIFESTVSFSENPRQLELKVSPGDTVTAKYTDRTLPSPHSKSSTLDVTATTKISGSSQGGSGSSTSQLKFSNLRFMDSVLKNQISKITAGQTFYIAADITNQGNSIQEYYYVPLIVEINEYSIGPGSVEPGKTFRAAISLGPIKDPGTYTVTAYLAKSYGSLSEFSQPENQLAPPLTTQIIVEQSNTQPTTDNPKNVPQWIINNVCWWSEGQISNSEYIQTAQYLVSNGFIDDVSRDATISSSVTIPPWLKNNAGWWCAGSISYDDFEQGIQYLVRESQVTSDASDQQTEISPEPTDLLSISTDKSSYKAGDMVTIRASMSNPSRVAILITDPEDYAVLTRTITPPNTVQFKAPDVAGTYTISATSEVNGITITDTETFVVMQSGSTGTPSDASVVIRSVTPIDQQGNPVSSFNKGRTGFVKVVVTADSEVEALVTVNLFDSDLTSLGVGAFKTELQPGTPQEIQMSFFIPDDASVGLGTIFANALSDWPAFEGVPLSDEAESEVIIR